MKSSCASRYGRHVSISIGQRIAVARRPALHDVGDVHVVAGQADALDEPGEQLARPPDERDRPGGPPRCARALAHEHQVGVAGRRRRTRPGCGPAVASGHRVQRERLALELVERRERRRLDGHGHGTMHAAPVRARRRSCAHRRPGPPSATTSATATRSRSRCASTAPVASRDDDVAVEAGVRRVQRRGAGRRARSGRAGGTPAFEHARRWRRRRAWCARPRSKGSGSGKPAAVGGRGRARRAPEPSASITSPIAFTTASAPTVASPTRADAMPRPPGTRVLRAAPLPDGRAAARRRPARSATRLAAASAARPRPRPPPRRGARRPTRRGRRSRRSGRSGPGRPRVGKPRPCSSRHAHDAVGRREPERRPAGEHDRVDVLDELRRVEQRGLARRRRAAAHLARRHGRAVGRERRR